MSRLSGYVYVLSGSLLFGATTLGSALASDDPHHDMSPMTTEDGWDGDGYDTASTGRSANVESKLRAEFTEFYGGPDQAAGVVEGLRTGDAFYLDDVQFDPVTGEVIENRLVIDPPTDGMGYGNVRLTMKLAQANLEQLGITHPTSEQLSAMLVGGDIDGVAFDGILTERAAGAGWGEIAKRYDVKVGELMGKASSTPHAVPVHVKATERAAAGSTGGNGYIPSGKNKFVYAGETGRGTQATLNGQGRKANGYIPSRASSSADSLRGMKRGAVPSSRGSVKKNGYIPSSNSSRGGAGLVTANGASSSRGVKAGNGHAKGVSQGYVPSSGGAGIVSAGNVATGSVSTAVGAQGRGQAKGLGKAHGKSK